MSAGTRAVRTHGSGCVAEQQGESAASSSRSKTPAREYPVWADCPAWGRERRESTTVSGWPACASGCTRSVDGWTSNRKSDGRSSPPSSLTPTAPASRSSETSGGLSRTCCCPAELGLVPPLEGFYAAAFRVLRNATLSIVSYCIRRGIVDRPSRRSQGTACTLRQRQ